LIDVAAFDQRNNITIGWMENNIKKLSTSKDDGRFIKGFDEKLNINQ
jgi:hypothetical protein